MEIGQQQAAHTVAEAATMLGVSQWLIRGAIRRGEIRGVRPSCVPRGQGENGSSRSGVAGVCRKLRRVL